MEKHVYYYLAAAAATIVALWLASIPVDYGTQFWLSMPLVVTVWLLRKGVTFIDGRDSSQIRTYRSLQQILRCIAIIGAAYVTLRYLYWRTAYTLEYTDPASYVGMWILYLAELYGITLYFMGLFVSIQPLQRQPVPLPADTNHWPSVDVFVTSYDEDPTLLETTLLAANQLRYPRSKLRVYLLDDGGTLQFRFAEDDAISQTARSRYTQLVNLCQQLGVTYLTRVANHNAKAGNINWALAQTHGDLVLVLDADHVPTVDFLEKTAGAFLADPKLAFIQTPHFFVNPDPVEHNLETFHKMPSENEMFYGMIQRGLDFWNAAVFCGSAGVLRRSYLQAVGGFSTDSITEDAATSLKLHGAGYNSAYLRVPLVAGLQPPNFAAFVRQRTRWAVGMTQIFRLHNPLFHPGLTASQRVGYLSSLLFWFFGYARLVFILAPTAFLLFGLKIYAANLLQVLAYTLPHILASWIVTDMVFGKFRWPFVSELYEYMLSVFTTPAVTRALFKPHQPKFLVTPKSGTVAENHVSALAKPFYILLAITLATLAVAIFKLYVAAENRDAVIINLVWELFNFFILLGALGALLERRQRRHRPRIDVNLQGRLLTTAGPVDCTVTSLSLSAATLTLPNSAKLPPAQRNILLRIRTDPDGAPVDLAVRKTNGDTTTSHCVVLFLPQNPEQKAALVRLVYGDSARWETELAQRDRYVGIIGSVAFLISTGLQHTVGHLGWIFRKASTILNRQAQQFRRGRSFSSPQRQRRQQKKVEL